MLFDLTEDPGELRDLGADPAHQTIVDRLMAALDSWALRPAQRTTISNDTLRAIRKQPSTKGVIIGIVTEDDMPAALTVRVRDRKAPPWQEIAGKDAARS